MFSLDLPQSFNLASVNSAIPKSTTVAPHMSAARIQASAWLYGIEGVNPGAARILDIGCGEASHLLPFALAYPQAEIVGIDLSAEKIEAGQLQFKLAGIKNTQLLCVDLESVLAGFGVKFDYIIIHGLFSLLDNQTREALFGFCSQHLSAQGLVAVQWSTQPGASLNQIIQDAIALHVRDANSEELRLSSARAALTWLSLGMSQNPAREALQEVIKEAEAMDDQTFALRYLHGMNNASYFVDFHENVSRAELRYVGDLFPWKECPEHYGDNVAELTAAACPHQDKLLVQQYLDFSVNRRSRFSLLTSAPNTQQISAQPDLARLKDLHWAASFRRDIDGSGKVYNRLRAESGAFIQTDDVVTLSVLDVLGEAWPLSMSFSQLAFHTRSPEVDKKEHEEKLLLSLGALFMQGSPGLHFQRVSSIYNAQKNPTLVPIFGKALAQLKAGFNLWNEPVELTAQEVSVLEKDNLAFADIKLVDSMRRKGLLMGSIASWQAHYQALIKTVTLPEMAGTILPLILFSSPEQRGGFDSAQLADNLNSLDKKNTLPVDPKIVNRLDALIVNSEFERARELAREQVSKMEGNPNAWLELSRVYSRTSEYGSAVGAINRTLSITSISWDIYFELAVALWHLQQDWLTGRIVRAILRADTRNALAWDALGRLYADYEAVAAAEYCYEKAIAITPNNSGMLSNLAVLVSDSLRMEESISLLRKAIKLNPSELGYYSRLNFGLAHSGKITPSELFEEHLVFGRVTEKWAKAQKTQFSWSANKDPHRRLRIGFVSGDLCHHPVSWFLKPFWTNLDRDRYELYVYNTSPLYDDVSNYFERTANMWRNVYTQSALELARLVNEDEVDILIDLSGHTAFNRLATFALKPAPVSLSWIGYPGTTGLKEMDYRICGTWMAQPGELDDQFTEKLLYMSMPVQYEPPASAPGINPLPALTNGVFTFGSLNRPKKISDKVVEAWAKILTAAPNARMLIGYMPSAEVSAVMRQRLETLGVKAEQLIFREKTTFDEYMKMHLEIDLMLDTFPYNGGTTSNNAAWMGIPTITLRGKTMAGCQGNEIIKAYQLEQFLVEDEESYVQQALAWMNKPDELNTIRLSMRERFALRKTESVDPAYIFGRLLRTIWQNYCAGNKPKSFVIDTDNEGESRD
ncbi:SAM-dependent methyltransferase [Enterobacter hormaechei]|uniref:protein O-GlcNAc transferase n=1 Tax=Phytobacter ursingii TaxID=1972431 RepID=A0AB35RSL4_9ENTR|nr:MULTISPECIES: methyltransferase regulatory domain-containing protein [Enterobacteriaceae]MDV2865143.1 methyltransferase regulatory domain-containing protein [Phytobacter ursingii]GJL37614.1 SAM-dependent methyltransferase [Enterobacter hormaechei]